MNFSGESLAFGVLAFIMTAAAVAAVSLRNAVHCGLSLAGAFAAVGGIYLVLGAEFLGFAQLLVYVGAVAVLIVFVIQLTRPLGDAIVWRPRPLLGTVAVAGLFVMLVAAILGHDWPTGSGEVAAVVEEKDTIASLGIALADDYIIPLQGVGVLLTAALIGAVVLAMKEENTG